MYHFACINKTASRLFKIGYYKIFFTQITYLQFYRSFTLCKTFAFLFMDPSEFITVKQFARNTKKQTWNPALLLITQNERFAQSVCSNLSGSKHFTIQNFNFRKDFISSQNSIPYKWISFPASALGTNTCILFVPIKICFS